MHVTSKICKTHSLLNIKVFIFQSEYSKFLCCFQSCAVHYKNMQLAIDSDVHLFKDLKA